MTSSAAWVTRVDTSRRYHAPPSLDTARNLYEQSDTPWVEFKDILVYNILIGDGQTFSGIHGAFVAKIGYHSISVFATPPRRYLIGRVDLGSRCLTIIVHTCTHCGFIERFLVEFFYIVCCAVLLLYQVLRPAVIQGGTVVNLSPSPDRSLARSLAVAHPPSLARRRRRRWSTPSLARLLACIITTYRYSTTTPSLCSQHAYYVDR